MPTELKLRESEDIQGDVIAGFKKDQMTLLFLKFEDAARARTWVRQLEPQISTTRQVAAFNAAFSKARKSSGGDDPQKLKATWMNVSFSYEGLKHLVGKEPLPTVPAGGTLEAFKQGSDKRSLGDVDGSRPDKWLFGDGHGQTVHAVLTIASDTLVDLQAAVTAQREATAKAGISIVFQQNGATLTGTRRGKEHFGFKDGVSEPAVQGFDEPDPEKPEYEKGKPGTRLIPAGEFVIGHPRIGGITYDPMPEWAENGSFHVVRRLAQDVPGWWAQISVQLKVLKEAKAVPEEATPEWLAARVVGRWRSGTPVAKCPNADRPFNALSGDDNDFGFKNDPEGFTTPLFSHLRKTNPRDGLQERPGAEPFPENPVMDRRRIMRRGSPYGAPFDPASEGPGGPDDPRGLLFVSYQSDLVEQFEFIQKSWINNVDFPPNRPNKPGPDPDVGPTGTVTWESPGASTKLTFNQFVTTEGSVYGFAPSLTTLRLLGEGRLTDKLPSAVRPTDAFLAVPDLYRQGGKSWFWAYGTGSSGPVARTISIADGSEHHDKVERPDRPLSTWPQIYTGVDRVDAVLPVPDEQRKNGRSRFWLFHTTEGRQVYRLISIADRAESGLPPDQAGTVDRGDRALTAWSSFDGIQQVDAFLPVPDQQRENGKSWFWVFHTFMGQQVYRLISIADGNAHTDVIERGDRSLSQWQSLAGISKVDEFLAVPDLQLVNGFSLFWVFHQDKYRIISIRSGAGHPDQESVADRALTLWTSLTS
ncbi:Dyp-type peroxidase family [Kitasatospora gansuensis]|uniref:Dyp-type peroxidase family n=1 Tax=Kitasatospora gansuensis TaxID=258050 RepID=A0A7W7SF06_9ACTN|nr:Dyp-type peroxidase [Kitasatospora gansuensis]MBB4949142.1 Dyp-type peroxidase family [Kitasatospora gansuensis]